MPSIAIPMPHAADREYAERAIPQYERAVTLAGGKPVRIALHQTAAEVMNAIQGCDGVLLPGSKADVDPARFHAERSPHAAATDSRREEVDNLLLEDAYLMRKPVLGICYGLQSLNVYRAGSLIQHIPDFLPLELRGKVNHEAGKTVAVAHKVAIEPGSKLGQIVCGERGGVSPGREPSIEVVSASRHAVGTGLVVAVNSSHHQAADVAGTGLRVVAHCPDDGIVEALEGTAADHFVLAVQWHPERSVDQDEPSRAIFRALVEAASQRPGASA